MSDLLSVPSPPPAHNSLHVADAEEELSFSVPGPHVQRCARGQAAFPPKDSDRVRELGMCTFADFAEV